MTAPPPTGRYYVVTTDGYPFGVYDDKHVAAMYVSARDILVECVAMPRVTVLDTGPGNVVVELNGFRVHCCMFATDARIYARDLRRALRGK